MQCPGALAHIRGFLIFLTAAALALALGSCPYTSLPRMPPKGMPDPDYVFDLSSVAEISITVGVDDWNRFLAFYDAFPPYPDTKDRGRHEELIRATVDITRGGIRESLTEVGLGLRGNTSRRRPEGGPETANASYWYQAWDDASSSYVTTPSVPHDPSGAEWAHAHFKLDIDAFLPEQKYHGYDKLILKWFKDDPTRAKEVYCYDLFRRFGAGLAPRSAYASLKLRVLEADGSITEASYGAYEMVEALDADFLEARKDLGLLESDDGYLFKCLYGADLRPFGLNDIIGVEDVRVGGSGAESDPFFRERYETYVYDLKTATAELPAAKAALIDFIEKLYYLDDDEFAAWIAGAFDVEGFLKALAVNVSLGMWDDYWYNNNNYYLYLERSGRVSFIPYDYDNTLGTGLDWFDPGTRSPLEWGDMTDRPLVTRILAIPEYMAAYRGYLAELMDPEKELFHADASIPRILAWRDLIRDAALDDDTQGDDPASTWDQDAPPSWGNPRPYLVLSGDDDETGAQPNFFRVRRKFTLQTLADTPPPAVAPAPDRKEPHQSTVFRPVFVLE